MKLAFIALLATELIAQVSAPTGLRARLASAPQLPLRRVDLSVATRPALEGISAVAGDVDGLIYVIHRPSDGDPIVVLDRSGNFVRSWGRGMFKLPHGIRVDRDGNIWTVDANTSIVYKFSKQGRKLLQIEIGNVPAESCGIAPTAIGATDIGFSRDGHPFVTDGYCNGRVIEYDQRGKKLREWGQHGTGPGEFNVAHSIAISQQGTFYVADRENGRIQKFDSRGKLLGMWKYEAQVFSLAFNRQGELFMSLRATGAEDDDMHVVRIDERDGAILGALAVRSHEIGVSADGTLFPGTRNNHVTYFVRQ